VTGFRALAIESWPTSGQWIPLINKDWAYYLDNSNDVGQGFLDYVTDTPGMEAYYWSSSTSLFFRMTLRQTPIDSRTGILTTRGAWFIALDVDRDTYMDWVIQLSGISNVLNTYPNATSYPDNTPDATANFSVSAPLSGGYAQVVAAGTTLNPSAVYLDVQIPYTAVQKTGNSKNISYSVTVPFKMFYATSGKENFTIKDALGPSTTITDAFLDANTYTPTLPTSYARIYETRDTAPYSNAGIWYRNEIVTVSGWNWPTSTSTYYNSGQRNVRVVDSGNSTIWSGVITTASDGTLTNAPMWTIDLTILPGIYRIEIEDPRNPGVYFPYDSFEIKAPIIAVQKTTSTPNVPTGANVSYAIQIQNTGNVEGTLSTITDLLPTNFSYVTGSSTGLTTTDPTIAGQQLTWIGNWSVPVSGSVTLNFQAKALQKGTFTNNATISGGNFAVKSTGETATVQVTGPLLTLSKMVDKTSASPGDTLTYSVTYSNTGDGDATFVFVLENIPSNTVYVINSASGSGTTITYSHNGGISYDANQTTPITNLSFQHTGTLAPGAGGSVSFKAIVK